MFTGTLTKTWLGFFLCLPTHPPWSRHRFLSCGKTRPTSLVGKFDQKWDRVKTKLVDHLYLQLSGLKRRWNSLTSLILAPPKLRSLVVTTQGWRRREWCLPWGLGKHTWQMGKNLKKLKMRKFFISWYLSQSWSNSETNVSHNVKFDARLVLFS